MGAVESALKLIPELAVETVELSCCGMAGSFGYDAATIDVSLKMGELSLLPAVRKADADALIVADGTSCRHQIHDGADRDAVACRARAGDEYRISALTHSCPNALLMPARTAKR